MLSARNTNAQMTLSPWRMLGVQGSRDTLYRLPCHLRQLCNNKIDIILKYLECRPLSVIYASCLASGGGPREQVGEASHRSNDSFSSVRDFSSRSHVGSGMRSEPGIQRPLLWYEI